MRLSSQRYLVAVFAVLLGAMSLSCDKKPEPRGNKSDSSATNSSGYAQLLEESVNAEQQLRRGLALQNAKFVLDALKAQPGLAKTRLSGVAPLGLACEWGNLEVVKALVENGAPLNELLTRGEWRSSMLWLAVSSRSIPTVEYLISKGMDPTAREVDGETLLWVAETVEMAKFLVAKGVDPKARDKFGDTALHRACRMSRKDIARFLLEAGVGIEIRGRWNMTPLNVLSSTWLGDAKSIAIMLIEDFKANVNARGFRGRTPLHDCAEANRLDMAHVLIKYSADPNINDDDGFTPVEVAKRAGEEDRQYLINLLIRNGAKGLLKPPTRLNPD